MKKLEGKVAVITGGNSGIGLETAKKFKEHGARLVIFGRNEKTLAEARQVVGDGTITVRGDVTQMADLDNLFALTREKFGGIDVLFVNAGMMKFAPVAMVPEALFDETMNVNFKAAFFTVQKAIPLLNEHASIIFNTSIANAKAATNASVYGASKAAIRSLAQSLASELAEKSIRVNTVSPGYVETPLMGRMGLTPEQLKGLEQHVLGKIKLKRFGRPEEVANAVLFLASSESSFITGEELVIDGGQLQT